jgi:hypothetical protein
VAFSLQLFLIQFFSGKYRNEDLQFCGIFRSWDFFLLVSRHGDQIGRIFAQWVIVYLGQRFENKRSNAHF